MSNIERYQLTLAWHVIDTHDQEDDPGAEGREMAAATSAADGEAIVAALNNHRGAVSLLDDLADVLADVSHGVVPRDGSVVRDVLKRAARHANEHPPCVSTGHAQHTGGTDGAG